MIILTTIFYDNYYYHYHHELHFVRIAPIFYSQFGCRHAMLSFSALLAISYWLRDQQREFVFFAGWTIIVFRCELAIMFGLMLLITLLYGKVNLKSLSLCIIFTGLFSLGKPSTSSLTSLLSTIPLSPPSLSHRPPSLTALPPYRSPSSLPSLCPFLFLSVIALCLRCPSCPCVVLALS